MITINYIMGLDIIKPLKIDIQYHGENNFIVKFALANQSASGDTVTEAINNLVDTISMTYKTLLENESNLGKEMTRQLDVLNEFVKE